MKYILHIDTATDTGIVALSGNGVLLRSRTNDEPRNQAAAINSMIKETLDEAEISSRELSAIAVCGGPGSYTGLRIGMATAKGFCYALNIPLIVDNRLTLLAQQTNRKYASSYAQYISLLVAREKEYFISIYNNDMVCILPPQHVTEERLNELINKKERTYIVTNTPNEIIINLGINDLVIDNDIKTDLNSWIIDAFDKYNCNAFVNLSEAEPFYLKQVYTHK